MIVEKFGIQNKICEIVTDNASNNQTMIEEIKKFKWTRFKGEAHWIQCFAHILNLIVQVIMRPFGRHQKNQATAEHEHKSDDEESDTDQQIQSFQAGTSDSDNEDDQCDTNNSMLAGELIEEDKIKLETKDVNELSDEEETDQYTTLSCKQTLGKTESHAPKFRAIARKLNKLPNLKALFVEICQETNCLKPHNIEHDVRTLWNSTLMQLEGILRCSKAIWSGCVY
ncbi:uncharacterized protein PGTG_18282 [Puccinia graminis f. sp. tritici CRL 75-36-700-3]|uniref:DUF659 domain-containing protein n=1 Tax=Puccinia graminis f. sp. tritici (strain CRL 75-36-700-3 / race SCCL) TaxID=418459 RepID=E3L7D2_PUCGT|nr:uncharacterized protein PGTG_18282 [Puccinia graminis f. sp. tritici CRL 75-36-700-3]EFP92457.2 hypothetical protein PGTG_18282 [Puccinia graminis f. sp. tritici CRL 75-36-700-3]